VEIHRRIADIWAFRYLLRGRFWADLWREINEDNCWGLAAQQSYYFLLAFFPFLIFLVALVSFIPVDPGLLDDILTGLQGLLPDTAYVMVSQILLDLVNSGDTGVLGFGLALTLWSASRALIGMTGVLNGAYEVRETRSFFLLQGLALGVTILVSIFVIVAAVLLFFGDRLIDLLLAVRPLEDQEALRITLRRTYTTARWLLVFLFLNIGLQIVYFTLPARRLPWKLISPGSLVATLLWIGASMGFRFYVDGFADYQRVYGSLGALIVLMFWFYISSLLLLVGGEIDSEIYRLRREEGRVDY
jgi:membrane protein